MSPETVSASGSEQGGIGHHPSERRTGPPRIEQQKHNAQEQRRAGDDQPLIEIAAARGQLAGHRLANR